MDVKELFAPFNSNIAYEAEYKFGYMIAMTPRSGSSYLSDVLSKTMLLGRPGEFLPYEHIKIAMDKLGRRGVSVQEHFSWVIRQTIVNGVFGQKGSYFQARPFFNWDGFDLFDYLFPETRFIYLLRRNIVKQAISLYIATETKLFHTNVQHGEDRIRLKESLEYDADKITFWIKHIFTQEVGWGRYFDEKNIEPLFFYYEDLVKDIDSGVRKIMEYVVGEGDYQGGSVSVFKKVSSAKNSEFYDRYVGSDKNIDMMVDMGISEDRF